ncbi:hypothetical protein SIL82_20525 [Sphingomonas echinoides]|uniref:Pectate lyase superfamily protein domain-containing protein n=1 Tax=Sphingomonas echinoides TaxID=59803 RepID=A0ABU4PR74_9SPHN|nr:hypothetical protein [Sphingomonas echinoides]MDX5986646.1 hypothetical protein [Sphingomonas echinoides]
MKMLSSMLWFAPSGAACASVANKELSVTSLGAIGDGRSHPVSEWIPARYPDLAAIRVDYPDVRTLEDEIDFAAINKAVRVAATRGAVVVLPAGTYLAWIYVRSGGVTVKGAGSDVCRLKLPPRARHLLTAEDGRPLAGTPCVVEVGDIGAGHRAPPLSGFTLSGVTLDGNRSATRAPRTTREDVFGWGLAFTNFSNARYTDVVAVECHAGGIGTFITSRAHVGEARVESCGGALGHPGFDVNSSQDGRWQITVDDCPYGVRLLDNCWNCNVEARINRAALAGLVCDNQRTNQSHSSTVTADIRGGCRNAGAQIGDGWSQSAFRLDVSDVAGIGVSSIGPGPGMRGESDNRFVVTTARCGGQSALIGGSRGTWRISSTDDAVGQPKGALFAIDVLGSGNILDIGVVVTVARRLRGLVFRPGARKNRAIFRARGELLESINDQGWGNSADAVG